MYKKAAKRKVKLGWLVPLTRRGMIETRMTRMERICADKPLKNLKLKIKCLGSCLRGPKSIKV
jgi:hypothetical protein